MTIEQDTNEEVSVFDESTEEIVPYRYSITSYGADYPVDSLVSRLDRDVIFIPTFQRSFVWSINQASRFIESLLLGLPVPGVFFSKESDSGKLLIIDGQQRLKTLQYFYRGIFHNGREFTLQHVQDRFEGKTIRTLEESDKNTLDDSIIHATIVKQDEPSDDESSIYHIFERLNTGGTQLQPQEIRACIFHGPLNELLAELNSTSLWRSIYGTPSKRLKDQELILRFFALFYNFDSYQRPMKEFLNDYMGKNKKLALQSKEELQNLFVTTINFISESLGREAFRPERTLNAAAYDGIMVGLARKIRIVTLNDRDTFKLKYRELITNTVFFNACKTATSDESNVISRIDLATRAFSDLT
jgi:uncharacterized protein with ParB-like and HNH nuclease domain